MKSNGHFKIMYSQVAQQIVLGVAESFKSFAYLEAKFYHGELPEKPKLPGYRKKGRLPGFTYPKQALKLDWETGLIRLPLGNEFKAEFSIDALYILMPKTAALHPFKIPATLGRGVSKKKFEIRNSRIRNYPRLKPWA